MSSPTDTVFVTMYHPALGNAQVLAPLIAVPTYQAHGWLLLDPAATPPPVATPFLTQAAGDSRYVRDWAGAETVTAGAIRMAPDGHVIVRTADGTSRSSYDTTEQAAWTAVGGGGAGGAVSSVVGQTGAVTGTQIAADPALRAAFVPKWKPSTAYASGELVLNPSGQIVSANTAFTSGTTYNASNWTVVSGGTGSAPSEAGTRLGTTTFDSSGNPLISYTTKIGIAGASSPSGLAQGTPYERDAGAYPGEEAVIIVDTNGAIVIRSPSASAVPHNSDPNAHAALLGTAATAADGKVSAHNSDPAAHPGLPRKGQGLATRWKSGGYLFVRGAPGVTLAPPNATEHCIPLPDVDRASAVDRMGVEVTVAGSTGALLRLGLRRDTGDGYPGALLYDAGTFDATTIGVKGDAAISALAAVALAAGDLLWFSCTTQGAPTTAPTVRAASGHIAGFTVAAATHYNRGGIYTQPGIAGPLPASFSATVSSTSPGPLGFVKVV